MIFEITVLVFRETFFREITVVENDKKSLIQLSIWRVFEKLKYGVKQLENAKIEKVKWDILSHFQTMWKCSRTIKWVGIEFPMDFSRQ